MDEITICIVNAIPDIVTRVLGVEREYVKTLVETGKIKIAPTPDTSLGDYGIAIHVLLRNIERSKWNEVGNEISRALYESIHDKCWVEKIEFVNGYVNVTIDYLNILKQLVETYSSKKIFSEMGNVGKGVRVIVEHTSANPVHPLHIGSGRNSIIGDTYARLLKKLGFDVSTRFYVNDLGRQVASLVYGVMIARSRGIEKPPYLKVDHWYGVIYALTNILIELSRLREEIRNISKGLFRDIEQACDMYISRDLNIEREIGLALCELSWKKSLRQEYLRKLRTLHRVLVNTGERVKNESILNNILVKLNELLDKLREYRDYLRSERKLSIYFPEVYTVLKSTIVDHREAVENIEKLMQMAEREDPDTLKLFREIAEEVVNGFKNTLSKIGVVFNGYDYESSREILRRAHVIVEELMKTGYTRIVEGGAVEVDLNTASIDHEYIRTLFYPDQAGRFIVRRRDGTTLYVTRDIAYSIYKFRDLGARKVFNVIAVEQSREQKQLRAVLYILGFREEAENLYHFAYEMVHLKNMKMSGRRGVYYTIDEMLVDYTLHILRKLQEKESKLDTSELLETSEKLAVANLRALLLSVDPGKVLVFDTEKISEVEYGTIIEYAFVRAEGVIRNLWGIEFLDNPDIVFLKLRNLSENIGKTNLSPEEKKLLEYLLRFKKTLEEAYSEMKPHKILEYAVNLAVDFNKFYEKHPVIGEQDPVKKSIKTSITVLVAVTLSELMDIMGLPKLRKM